jgi:hypothetical protein
MSEMCRDSMSLCELDSRLLTTRALYLCQALGAHASLQSYHALATHTIPQPCSCSSPDIFSVVDCSARQALQLLRCSRATLCRRGSRVAHAFEALWPLRPTAPRWCGAKTRATGARRESPKLVSAGGHAAGVVGTRAEAGAASVLAGSPDVDRQHSPAAERRADGHRECGACGGSPWAGTDQV